MLCASRLCRWECMMWQPPYSNASEDARGHVLQRGCGRRVQRRRVDMAAIERCTPPSVERATALVRVTYMGSARSAERMLMRDTISRRLTVPGVSGRLDSRRKCVTTTASASPRFQKPWDRHVIVKQPPRQAHKATQGHAPIGGLGQTAFGHGPLRWLGRSGHTTRPAAAR